MVIWVPPDERSASELMRSFLGTIGHMDQGDGTSADQTAHLARAMSQLVDLAVLLYAEPEAEWTKTELPAFRRNARELLAPNLPILSRYQAGMETAIWTSTPQDWYVACRRRSAIQFVIDEIDPGGDPPLIEIHRICEDDEDMRDMAPNLERLPIESIPSLPATHFWWHAPDV